jgi:hypothetical protein
MEKEEDITVRELIERYPNRGFTVWRSDMCLLSFEKEDL